ncbi:MAG: VCBS repeat-containing protein [Balneolaceae bacterium]
MKQRKKLLLILTGLGAIIILIYSLQQFMNEGPVSEGSETAGSETGIRETGKPLAERHCSGCHLFPEADLLDKRIWMTQTLPAMGPYLGIKEFNGEEYTLDVTPGLPENFYPEEALIDSAAWQKILDYYASEAPERLTFPQPEPEIVQEDLFFRVRRPAYRVTANPMASAVRFDPANQLIYLADATVEKLLVYNRELEIISSFDIPSPISDIRFTGNPVAKGVRDLLLTHIGNIAPSDERDGSVLKGWYDPDTGDGDFTTVIIDNIRRPVETIPADLDQDGRKDLLISEFGHRRGSLFWLRSTADGYDPEKKVLIDTPGCMQSHVTDFTLNGSPDVLALCSQVDQAIWLFENNGDGTFNRKTLLRFPVTAGSSSFELADFNDDGHEDIIYTSGDNADYSISYKPYHGVYIYINDRNGNFSKEWFYPVNGAYSAKARDFTGNGSLDIALISFFADYAAKPQEGFVFFRNNGDLTFTAHHPQRASYGRWITMDVADWSGNGAEDIVLANFSRGPTKVLPQIEAILTQSPHLLLLENLSGEDLD